MASPTLRQRLGRCKHEIAKARAQHKPRADAYREAIEIMKRIIRRENAQVRRGEHA